MRQASIESQHFNRSIGSDFADSSTLDNRKPSKSTWVQAGVRIRNFICCRDEKKQAEEF
jgi:hypothetical protein